MCMAMRGVSLTYSVLYFLDFTYSLHESRNNLLKIFAPTEAGPGVHTTVMNNKNENEEMEEGNEDAEVAEAAQRAQEAAEEEAARVAAAQARAARCGRGRGRGTGR